MAVPMGGWHKFGVELANAKATEGAVGGIEAAFVFWGGSGHAAILAKAGAMEKGEGGFARGKGGLIRRNAGQFDSDLRFTGGRRGHQA
ncbi:hypothetical protein GCM10007315_17720 [Gemmobacter tilapiae]|uniref:Uncharacterized protein n=1 Tax=Neogemmobacter tilapiae TaxID=875041 RepID=A0A918TN79_9RHOB|nr:hypothetical protein GCM10007315_17720 [Gemmobacter tilapiae]